MSSLGRVVSSSLFDIIILRTIKNIYSFDLQPYSKITYENIDISVCQVKNMYGPMQSGK